MSITINGTGSISGLSAGGLPDASVTPADLSQPLPLETAKSATGTSIDFTGIPSWVKRITVMFDGVSTNGSSTVQVQLGTGVGPTFTTSGYLGSSGAMQTASTLTELNGTGFKVDANHNSAAVLHGAALLAKITGNTWTLLSILGESNGPRMNHAGGSIALAAGLTAIRITTVNGTDTFDAGSVNILYE